MIMITLALEKADIFEFPGNEGVAFVTATVAANALLVNSTTIRNWLKSGKVEGLRRGDRYFVRVDSLQRVMEWNLFVYHNQSHQS